MGAQKVTGDEYNLYQDYTEICSQEGIKKPMNLASFIIALRKETDFSCFKSAKTGL